MKYLRNKIYVKDNSHQTVKKWQYHSPERKEETKYPSSHKTTYTYNITLKSYFDKSVSYVSHFPRCMAKKVSLLSIQNSMLIFLNDCETTSPITNKWCHIMQAKHYDTSYRDTGKRKNFLRKLNNFREILTNPFTSYRD